jgi:hypothetical protein
MHGAHLERMPQQHSWDVNVLQTPDWPLSLIVITAGFELVSAQAGFVRRLISCFVEFSIIVRLAETQLAMF